MKNVLKATVVSVGFALATASAWAQFAPNMNAAAVKAQVQQQMAAKVTVEAIVQAAMKANVAPASVIDAVLALTAPDKRLETVSLLSTLYKNNPAALQALASAPSRNPQLGLKSEQVVQVLASNLSSSEFQLAGLGNAASAATGPTTGTLTAVNSLFGGNGPVSGTGGGRVASPN